MRPRYIGYDKYVLVSSVELKIAWISPLLVSIKLPTECIFQQDRISAQGWFESHLMVQNRFLLVISSLYSQVLLEGCIQAMFFSTRVPILLYPPDGNNPPKKEREKPQPAQYLVIISFIILGFG